MSLDYILVRSKRRSVALHVQFDGSLLVRAPLRASKKVIDSFVMSKEKWIEKQRQKLIHQISTQQEKLIDPYHYILYFGKFYPVEIAEQDEKKVFFDGKKFLIARKNYSQAASMIEAWFRHEAQRILFDRVSWYARNHHFKPKKVRITSARTRWGSCSNLGTISFSWRLIMAPPHVVDYVVVHELVHLLEKNHQKSFWAKVALILPDYESRRKWLKIHGGGIMNNVVVNA
jgi:predicted metal-dependent hydrolase